MSQLYVLRARIVAMSTSLKPWGSKKEDAGRSGQLLKCWNKQRRVQNYGAPVRSVEFQTFVGALWYSDSKAG